MEQWIADLVDTARAGLRPMSGEIPSEGLTETVEVLTDRWGVPHVYAENADDLYFAQGHLHASERLWQIDLTRRLAQGRLSEILGEFAVGLDKFFRTLGLERTARGWLDQGIDQDTRRIGEPYAAGFRAGAGQAGTPLEHTILGVEPHIPATFEDAVLNTYSIALLMAFTLSANWQNELMRAWLARQLGPERARQLSPFVGQVSPAAVPASQEIPALLSELTTYVRAAGGVPGVGSNNWVVSGEKSSSGKPLLANDPHLMIQMPSIWMEMHLVSPQMQVAGVTLPGTPGVIIGHNDRIAWGFTNTQGDVADLYLEKLSPDGRSYEFRGEMLPVEVVTEEIQVANRPEPILHEVRRTHHGPLITSILKGQTNVTVDEDAINEALAFRWIHHDFVPSQMAIVGLNTASNWQEFREAARLWPSAGQNMVYADVDGNIGYQFTGTLPIRPRGTSGAAPLPGWTGEHEWEGTIPFDHLPSSYNPQSGFIATANNRMADLDYPYYLTNDWEPEYRVRRITTLLSEKQKLDAEDFKRIQMDTRSGIADDLLPLILPALETNGGDEPLKHLQTWDHHLDADSVGASIFHVLVTKLVEAILKPHLGEELFTLYFELRGGTILWGFDALGDILTRPSAEWVGGDGSDNLAARDRMIVTAWESALKDLSARLGPDPSDWRWGRLHRAHFRHPLTTAMPPLDEILSAGPYESAGGDDTVNRGVFCPGEDYAQSAVSSYRQIIDLSNFDRSISVITTGNSGNPASEHYRDQAPMWLRGEYHPMPFSREAVESHSTGTFRLTPL